jgi:hypothetical protein
MDVTQFVEMPSMKGDQIILHGYCCMEPEPEAEETVLKWCREQFGPIKRKNPKRWLLNYGVFYFSREADAMLFKLKWL